jgi:diaminopimelate decarboxylase
MDFTLQQLCILYKVPFTLSKNDNLNEFIHYAVILMGKIDIESLSNLECNENIKIASLLSLKLSFLATFSNDEQIAYIEGIDNSLNNNERENDIYLSSNFFNGRVTNETTCNVIIEKLKDNGIILHINDILQIIPFSHRTEMILSFGGDDRLILHMNKNKVNKYGSSSLPYENVIRRGSCTCSTITTKVYLECDQYRVELLQKSLILDPSYVENMIYNEQNSIRNRFKKVFNMNNTGPNGTSQGEIVLFPSGSDAEFLPCIVAIERSLKLISSTNNNTSNSKFPKVYNFVTAAGEVGSGTAAASGLKHFSAISPRRDGKVLEMNKLIDGIGEDIINVIQYKPRATDGSIDLLEDEIILDIRNKLNNNETSVAILHVVVGTKTGIIYPSLDTVSIVEKEFGDRVIIVIDACQLRIRLDSEFLDKNYIVLFTGSKYFSGPPFSGGVAIPNKVAASIEYYMKLCNDNDELVKNSIPYGLVDYLTAYEIPSSMKEFRKFLGIHPKWSNIGLLFRFHCALPILEAYSSLKPSDILSFTQSWVNHTVDLINNEFSSSIKIVKANNSKANLMYGNLNTVISFSIYVDDEDSNNKKFLTFDELKTFHQKIGIPFLIDNNDNNDSINNTISNTRIMLGQPVKLSETTGYAVIRIALDANMLVDALSSISFVEIGFAVNKIFQEDLLVLKKIDLLAKHWNQMNNSKSFPLLLNRMKKFDQELCMSMPSSCTAMSTSIDIMSNVLTNVKDIPIVAMYYNIDSYISTINSLKQSFNKPNSTSTFIHCFAIKSCPLSYICHTSISNGLGLECASLQEVIQALRCGCPANIIMFDSPCKCVDDIRFALLNGVHMNANTIAEVTRIKNVIDDLKQEGKTIIGTAGLRINPLVGAGNNSALSTATSTSKFGVPLISNGGGDDNEDEIIQIFVNNPFLNGVMCHVGSQGMPIGLMVNGVNCIVDLADKIDLACLSIDGKKRITNLDIGGGLSANYESDIVTPTFEDYSTSLLNSCPKLFTCGRIIYTEMGKSLIAKSGVIVTKIEDTIKEIGDKNGHVTAVAHAGADILLRTAYCPNKFTHRINLLNNNGEVLKTSNNNNDRSNQIRNSISTTIAGPLCFSGDVLATRQMLPEAQAGDYCCILDAGANTISIFRLLNNIFLY